MSKPINHHYLPQCYLREFSPNKEIGDNVFSINLIGNKKITNPRVPEYVPPEKCKSTNVENIGAEKYRNTIMDIDTNEYDHATIEAMFCKIESIYPDFINELSAIEYGEVNENFYTKIDDERLIVGIKMIIIITYSRLQRVDEDLLLLNDDKKFHKLYEVIESLKEICELISKYEEGYEFDDVFSELEIGEFDLFIKNKDFFDNILNLPFLSDLSHHLDESLFKMMERTVKFTKYRELLKNNLNFYLVKSSPELSFITSEYPFIISKDIMDGFIFIISPQFALQYYLNPPNEKEPYDYVFFCNNSIINDARSFLVSNNENLLNKYIQEWHVLRKKRS